MKHLYFRFRFLWRVVIKSHPLWLILRNKNWKYKEQHNLHFKINMNEILKIPWISSIFFKNEFNTRRVNKNIHWGVDCWMNASAIVRKTEWKRVVLYIYICSNTHILSHWCLFPIQKMHAYENTLLRQTFSLLFSC